MITEDTLVDSQPPPRRRTFLKVFMATLLLGAVGLASGGAFLMWGMGGSKTGAPVRVIVDEGDSGARIAQKLEAAKVIRSAFVFRLIARIRGVSTDLKPGAYELRRNMGVSAALDKLRTGVPLKVFRFTIPEGKTVIEIALIVDRATPITSKQFLAAARSGRHRLPFMPSKTRSLEGLLFPNTYEIVEKTTADQVVDLLLGEFRRRTADIDMQARAKALGITQYEAIVVASLIEREARVQKDRPLVSSVIYNRIDRGMRLQIDATVQYAIQLETGKYKGEGLTQDDYTDVRSPYNTYLIDGLPPTPIGAPGLASIQAALSPAKTNFLFYRLKRGTNEHCFAVDGAGHQRCANA